MAQSNPANAGFSFTPEQVQNVLNSKEGKRLIELLSRDGGAALRAAAASVQAGDQETAKKLIQPLVQNPEAARLLSQLERK